MKFVENKQKLFFSVALVVASQCALAVNPLFPPWKDQNDVSSKLAGYREADLQVARNDILNQQLSPSGFHDAVPEFRYQQKPRLIAHRGLVDNSKGIVENSLSAINNSINNRVNMIEVDVQATKDGIPVGIHDDSLIRMLAVNKNVSAVNYNEIAGKPLYLRNPLNNRYYKTNQTLTRLDVMLNAVAQAHPGATFFVDPKNLGSAKAVARMAMNNGSLATRIFMKTYTVYWGTGAPYALYSEARTPAQRANLQRMKIMPVDNMSNEPGGIGSQQAINTAIADVRRWGQYWEVASVELPGFWNAGWNNLKTGLSARLKNTDMPHNPHGYKPIMSTGYRFEDFKSGGIYYDFAMTGAKQPDNVNVARRTVGAQKGAAGWATTDLPLQEALSITRGQKFPPGNPFVNF